MKKFSLFLSYARKDEFITVATKSRSRVMDLKRALELHRHPKTGERLAVCTDRDDFRLGRSNRGVIAEMIDRCDGFLVLCSPSSPNRPLVQFEVQRATKRRRKARIFAANAGIAPDKAFPNIFDADAPALELQPVPQWHLKDWLKHVQSQSHKLARELWQVDEASVIDRFNLDRRRQVRNRTMSFLAISALAIVILILGSSIGYHITERFDPDSINVKASGFAITAKGESAVAIATSDGITWWSARGGKTHYAVQVPHLWTADFSDAGSVFVAVDSRLSKISMEGTSSTDVFEAPGRIIALAVDDGRIAVVADDRLFTGSLGHTFIEAPRPEVTAGGWRPPKFRTLGPIKYGERLAWMNGGKWLAVGSSRGHVVLLDPKTGKFAVPGRPLFFQTKDGYQIKDLCFEKGPTGRLLFSDGKAIFLADLAPDTTLAEPKVYPLPRTAGMARSLSLRNDDRLLAIATGATIEWFSRKRDGFIWTGSTPIPGGEADGLVFSRDGNQVLVWGFNMPCYMLTNSLRTFGRNIPFP
jgi:hypothetical protein